MGEEIAESEKVKQLRAKLAWGRDSQRQDTGELETGRMVPNLPPSWFHWLRSKLQPQHSLLTLHGLHLSDTHCSDRHLGDPELLRARTVPDASVSLRAWLRV